MHCRSLLKLLWCYLILLSVCRSTSCNEIDSSFFVNGSFRIIESGKYCLSSDIVLNSGEYFAAIIIETNDVELDLKNHEIKMDFAFYILQRSFTMIQIGSNDLVSNINIHDGIIGLSSNFGIHSSKANNVSIFNINIYDFEIAGIQMNEFNNLILNNLIIGPSSTKVLPSAYYSSAKYLSSHLDNIHSNSSITFAGDRIMSLQQIYDDLTTSLDIALRWFLGETSDDDINNELYDASISLYNNPMSLPDDAVLYGINLMNGNELSASNIKITDLTLNNNEIPAIYMNECTDDDDDIDVLKGASGDVMDIRRMLGSTDNALIIDLGDDYTSLSYVGNPLSDAQIAFDNTLPAPFLKWALNEYSSESYHGIPECTQFICNSDIMFNSNGGIIGFRLDDVNDVIIENVVIKRLINKSPLTSYACDNYTRSRDDNKGIGTDTKGMSVIGGDVVFDGFNNVIEKLVSYNGDVVGLDIKQDANIVFDYVFQHDIPQKEDDIDTEDDRSALHIKQLCPGHEISFALLAELMVDEKYPYPNDFYACNVLIDNKDSASITPYPPNGIDSIWCADYVPQNVDDNIGNVFPVGIIVEEEQEEEVEEEEQEEEPQSTASGENELTSTISVAAAESVKNKMNNILGINNDDIDDDIDILDKYPNAPYVYFFLGLICIIMVVFVVVTFIMKCGKMIMNSNRIYSKARYIDSDFNDDSDDTNYEDEPQHQI